MAAKVLDTDSLPPHSQPPDELLKAEQTQRDRFHHAARTSWLAPIIALFVGIVSFVLRENNRTAAIVVAAVSVLIILLGLIFAVMALCGVRGRRGIVVPATIGLVLNLLMVALLAGGIISMMRTPSRGSPATPMSVAPPLPSISPTVAALAPSAEPVLPPVPAVPPPAGQVMAEQQRSREAIENFPGWIGISQRLGGLVLVIAQANEKAPGTHDFKDRFTAPCAVIWIAANNTSGDAPHVIDPASLVVHFADFHTTAALVPAPIIATARTPNDPVLARCAQPARVEPRALLPDCAAFLPADIDLTHATAITLVLDGQRVVIPGRYFSVEEKALLLRIGKQQQSQPKAP